MALLKWRNEATTLSSQPTVAKLSRYITPEHLEPQDGLETSGLLSLVNTVKYQSGNSISIRKRFFHHTTEATYAIRKTKAKKRFAKSERQKLTKQSEQSVG